MEAGIVSYRDWVFEVERELTQQTYHKVSASGADTCPCSECKNYVAYRDKVFPGEVRKLLADLGIDYRKEVEVTAYETHPEGLHHIGGWFHFRGRMLKGKDCHVPLPGGGYTFDLIRVSNNFSIGFTESSDLTYFEDRTGLIQVEFDTNIPWFIDKALESTG